MGNPNSAAKGKLHRLVVKNTKPPDDQGCWQGFTMEFLESPAFRSLSVNAHKALMRIVIEHTAHGRFENGALIVTHANFVEYSCTPDLVADAISELDFKGLVKVRAGRGGLGETHPNIFRLTFTGNKDGAPATNEWHGISEQQAKSWRLKRKALANLRSRKQPKKKNSPLGNLLGCPLGENLGCYTDTRKTPSGIPTPNSPSTIDIIPQGTNSTSTSGQIKKPAKASACDNVIKFKQTSTNSNSLQQAEEEVVKALGGWECIEQFEPVFESLVAKHHQEQLPFELIRSIATSSLFTGLEALNG